LSTEGINKNMTEVSYIQQVRRLSDGFFSEKGRQPSMFIQTFGCQMNERESEKLHGLLLAMGYSESPGEAEADLVLYNTCCVRGSAENRVYGKLGNLKIYKKKNPDKVIVLCGCMPQREEVMEEISRHHRQVDIVFGTFNKHHFPRLLFEYLTHRKRVIEILKDHTEEAEEEASIDEFDGQTTRFLSHKAGVTVMHGCNNYCAYCIVPYVRGREKSRSVEEILTEIAALAADGVKEILLLGQNVNSYGKELGLSGDQASSISFAGLLRQINEISGLRRIRFMTSHPKDLSQDLIDAIRDCDKVCKHIHLPMQAGSSAILEAMNRGYTKEQYLQLIDRLREAVPDIAITTDIIVGFPGESEADFCDTLDVVEKAKLAGAFTFIYSPREGTPAADLADMKEKELPKAIVHQRFNRLIEAINPLQLAHNQRLVHKTVKVMVDGEADKPGLFTGRTDDNVLVHFESEGDLALGDIVDVEITGCKTFYATGKMDRSESYL